MHDHNKVYYHMNIMYILLESEPVRRGEDGKNSSSLSDEKSAEETKRNLKILRF